MNLLREAKTPYGGRRFYPVGQHPATYRERMILQKAIELQDQGADCAHLVFYLKRMLAEFEYGESVAKTRYLQYHGL